MRALDCTTTHASDRTSSTLRRDLRTAGTMPAPRNHQVVSTSDCIISHSMSSNHGCSTLFHDLIKTRRSSFPDEPQCPCDLLASSDSPSVCMMSLLHLPFSCIRSLFRLDATNRSPLLQTTGSPPLRILATPANQPPQTNCPNKIAFKAGCGGVQRAQNMVYRLASEPPEEESQDHRLGEPRRPLIPNLRRLLAVTLKRAEAR